MADILVCDDDDDFADMLMRYLKSLGHAAERCHDAVAVASQLLKKRPDMLVCDIEMPGGGGIATTRFLKSIGADSLPIIVCSGLPLEEQKGFFSGLKRIAFFQKPVDLDAFERTLREFLP